MDHAVDQMLQEIRIDLDWIQELMLSDVLRHRLHKATQVLEVGRGRI